jgi:hypothetical protein
MTRGSVVAQMSNVCPVFGIGVGMERLPPAILPPCGGDARQGRGGYCPGIREPLIYVRKMTAGR